MTKEFILENLCCPNCAAKMERKINKLSGVNSATINFMTTKLIADIESEAVIADIEKTVKKIEHNVELKAY